MEVLLGSFDGFMQKCDFQIDSFRAHLLEFLELQVSGIRGRPRHPGSAAPRGPVRTRARSGRGASEPISGTSVSTPPSPILPPDSRLPPMPLALDRVSSLGFSVGAPGLS